MPAEPRPTDPGEAGTVAVVLSGAVARGAFQAGALCELIPALEAQGLTPRIWLGTSAGAINAGLWAAAAHRGPVAAAEELVTVWGSINADDVYAPPPLSALRAGGQFAAGALLGIGPGTTSLLDTHPLQQTTADLLDPDQLATNIAAGHLSALGIVATRVPTDTDSTVPGAASGRSVLFLHEHTPSGYTGDSRRALDVVHGRLTADHVLASSAFPAVFPPVRIHDPQPGQGWYVDGGVRLNTPLNPAIDLGASKIVLVSATATTYPETPSPDQTLESPDLADAAAQVAHTILADRAIEDLNNVLRVNHLIDQAAAAGHHRLLTDRPGGRAYRPIDVMTVSPPAGCMAAIATDVFQHKTAGLRRLTDLDNWVIGKLLRGAGDGVGRQELLSYFLFDQEYFARSITLGRETARRALQDGWKHQQTH